MPERSALGFNADAVVHGTSNPLLAAEVEANRVLWLPACVLLTRAKGIYKAAWTDYALSVRQVFGGPYPDLDPIVRPDGTWSYRYYLEQTNPADRDAQFTNVGLMRC